ncbi:MAG: hypothetical protein H6747_01260 [Deltaproteobacteria bacterium]|nr:hypothetical protein [Deltaproteobacteria bacterium]
MPGTSTKELKELEAGLRTAAKLDAEELLAHEITVFRDRLCVDVPNEVPGISTARPSSALDSLLPVARWAPPTQAVIASS